MWCKKLFARRSGLCHSDLSLGFRVRRVMAETLGRETFILYDLAMG